MQLCFLVFVLSHFVVGVLSQIECTCDFALVLDPNLQPADRLNVQTFSKNVINSLGISANKPDGPRMSLVMFGDHMLTVDLTTNITKVTQPINDYYNLGGNHDLSMGIQQATSLLTNNRPAEKCVTMLVVEAFGSPHPTDTILMANTAKSKGITIVSFGITSLQNSTEVVMVATPPLEENALSFTDSASLVPSSNTLFASCSHPQNTTFVDMCMCDVMIVFDLSTTISPQDLLHLKDFGRTLVSNYDNGGHLSSDGARIALLSYSDVVIVHESLTYDGSSLLSSINSLSSTTRPAAANITKALIEADRQLYSSRRPARNGQEATCQTVKLITSTGIVDTTTATQAAFTMREDHDIIIQTIGVGPLVDEAQLTGLASPPYSGKDSNVLIVDTYDAVVKIAQMNTQSCGPKIPPAYNYDMCNCDWMFLLDAGVSVTASQWHQQNMLVGMIGGNLTSGRIGIIHYHHNATVRLDLTNNMTAIMDALKSNKTTMMPFPGAATITPALDLANSALIAHSEGLGKCRVVTVMTSALFTDDPMVAMHAAQTLKVSAQADIMIIAPSNHTSFTMLSTDAMPVTVTQDFKVAILPSIGGCKAGGVSPAVPSGPSSVPAQVTSNPYTSCQCDVILVLDASGSIDTNDWVHVLDWARILVTGLAPFMAHGHSRIGIVKFSSKAELALPLTYDSNAAQNTIDALQKTTGTTRTDLALELALAEFMKDDPSNANGCRSVQLVTDGRSNDGSKTRAAADDLKKLAWVSAIGVGPLANTPELEDISTSKNYTVITNFVHLGPLAHIIADRCLDKAGLENTVTPLFEPDTCNCDIMLVLDASGSIWNIHWTHVKEYANTMVLDLQDRLNIGAVRIGIVIFANRAQMILPLTTNKQQLLHTIQTMNKTNGSTRTWLGLNTARDELVSNSKGLSSCKVIQLITDGNSNIKSKTINTAATIKRTDGIVIMGIGVGPLITDQGELKSVVSVPVSTNMHFIDDFSSLQALSHLVYDKCQTQEPFSICGCDFVAVVDLNIAPQAAVASVKQWLAIIIKQLNPFMMKHEVRMGIVTMGGVSIVEANLTASYKELQSVVLKMQSRTETAQTHLGLQLAGQILMENARSASSCRGIYLITDQTSPIPAKTSDTADYLKEHDHITIHAIGIGNNVSIEELQDIVSAPEGSNLQLYTDYSQLGQLARLMTEQCHVPHKSLCDPSDFNSCLVSNFPNDDCDIPNVYNTCANKHKCTGLVGVWCTEGKYSQCNSTKTLCKKQMAAPPTTCDAMGYAACLKSVGVGSGSNQCDATQKKLYCASVNSCQDMMAYLCYQAETVVGCATTPQLCTGAMSMVDTFEDPLVTALKANYHPDNHFSFAVPLLGAIVAGITLLVVAAAVKYGHARNNEELEQQLL